MIFDAQKHTLEVSVDDALKMIHALTTLLETRNRGYQLVPIQTLPMLVQDGKWEDGRDKFFSHKLTIMMEKVD